jgi:hypothetical protein
MPAADWGHCGAYRVEVRGRLTDRFAAAFDGLRIEPGSGSRAGTTVLAGPVRDQSHLMGILQTLDALGIELISINPDPPAPGRSAAHGDASSAEAPYRDAATGPDAGSPAAQSRTPTSMAPGSGTSHVTETFEHSDGPLLTLPMSFDSTGGRSSGGYDSE